MVKASALQSSELKSLSDFVIEVMLGIDIWSEQQLTSLTKVELGVLRKNATQRHGVTRWKRGIRNPQGPNDVEVIDLHPRLLSKKWHPYAACVLHHEFIHALGFLPHDSKFKSLEALWPSEQSKKMGKGFTEMLRMERATWLWTCPTCGKEHPRQKQGKGKYMCRICKSKLIDVPNKAAQS